jgi:hypothetical protein
LTGCGWVFVGLAEWTLTGGAVEKLIPRKVLRKSLR